MNDDRPLMKSDVVPMLEAFGQELLATVLELLSAGPAGAAAIRKAGARPDAGLDPQFIAAREEIRKSIANPLVSLGDAGYRRDDGIHKIATTDSHDAGDVRPRSALAAIRGRRERGSR